MAILEGVPDCEFFHDKNYVALIFKLPLPPRLPESFRSLRQRTFSRVLCNLAMRAARKCKSNRAGLAKFWFAAHHL